MAEHGVRYVTVRVHARNVTDWEEDVTAALLAHKVPVSFSGVPHPAFDEAEVVQVQLSHQYRGDR